MIMVVRGPDEEAEVEDIKFIDTHAHYNMPAFAEDLDDVLGSIREVGVEKVICPAVSYASNEQMLRVLGNRLEVFFALGIHPKHACPKKATKAAPPDLAGMKRLRRWHQIRLEALDELEREVESLRPMAGANDRVVAIGEAGLDWSLGPSEFERQVQVALFCLQIELVLDLRLPLVLHVRDAHADAVAVLRKYHGAAKGVVHCFTGSRRDAEEYLELGLHLGIGGRVTHDNREECAGLREAVSTAPADRLLLETDAPYVLPKGFGSMRNDSTAIPRIAREVARLRGVDVAEIARATTTNAEKLFFGY